MTSLHVKIYRNVHQTTQDCCYCLLVDQETEINVWLTPSLTC